MKKLIIVLLFIILIASVIWSVTNKKAIDFSMLAVAGIGIITPKKNIIGKEFKNSIKTRGLIDHMLCNSNGSIDPTSAGYQVLIDTLSYIRSEVIEQTFYTVPIAEFMPVDVGEAAWGSEIVQNISILTGGDFFAGDIGANAGQGKSAGVGSFLTPNRIPTQLWQKHTNWTTVEIKQAAALNKWDVISSRLSSLKENWDLGIQEMAFLGHPYISTMTGLINNSNVTINTSIITTPISDMSVAELKVLLAGLLDAYWSNSNNTVLPDTFLIPSSDYLGLGDFVGDTGVTNPLILKIEVIENMLKKMTRNEKFKVNMVAYCDSARNACRGITKNRYVLYRNDPKTLKMSIPIDINILEANTADGFNWSQGGYGQYSGVLVSRVPEILYLDETAANT